MITPREIPKFLQSRIDSEIVYHRALTLGICSPSLKKRGTLNQGLTRKLMRYIMLFAILFLLTWVINSHKYRHHSKSLRWTYSPLLYENTHLLWHHFPAFSQRGREWWEWCSFRPSGLVWRDERVALLIKHYPFSVSHCEHYWQALDLELERNLPGVPVITRLGTYSLSAFACVCVWVCEKEDGLVSP